MFSYSQWLDDLIKAAGHKYIKRIPYQSGGKLRYRYIYNVTHTHQGKHVLDPDHMKVGTKLMLDATSGKEVHGHITAVSGDKVTFAYDDGPRKGESVTMSKAELATELDKVHGISEKLSTARAKQKAVVDKLKERGASEKQIAREQKRLDALGGEAEKEDARVVRLPAAEKIIGKYKRKDGREIGVWSMDKETIDRAERGDYEALEKLKRGAESMVGLLRKMGESEEAIKPYKDALAQIEGPYREAQNRVLDQALERFGANFDRVTRENEEKRKRFIAQKIKEEDERKKRGEKVGLQDILERPEKEKSQRAEHGGGRKKQEEANREKQFARLLSETEPNNVRLSNVVTVADMKQKLRASERLKRVRPFGVAGETNPEWSRMLKRPLDSEANRALMRQRVITELDDYIHGVGTDALHGMREVDQDLKVMRYSLNSAGKRASDEAISAFRQAYQQRYDDLFYQNVERTEGEALDAIRSKVLEGAPEWAKEVFEEEYRSRRSVPNVPSNALKEPTAVFKSGFTFRTWASVFTKQANL